MKQLVKPTIIALILILSLASCSSTRGVRSNDGWFYKGQVIKANGKVKQKTFIFGRDQCVRKSKRMARRRAAMRSPDRNPAFGITSMGRAKQRM